MDWLQKIFDKLLTLFPVVQILTPYESGVRFTFGRWYKKLGPGWYVYWPLIQNVVWMEIQTQLADLKTQSITTSDEKDIMVSGAIQYRISDIEKAVMKVQDVDKSLMTLALGIILKFVSKHTFSECKDTNGLQEEILKGIREEAQGWGLKIEKVFITDMGKTRNIRLLGDNLYGGSSNN
jgi:regulator of protease activity HflC (stomatin/prohibitin superfamily)